MVSSTDMHSYFKFWYHMIVRPFGAGSINAWKLWEFIMIMYSHYLYFFRQNIQISILNSLNFVLQHCNNIDTTVVTTVKYPNKVNKTPPPKKTLWNKKEKDKYWLLALPHDISVELPLKQSCVHVCYLFVWSGISTFIIECGALILWKNYPASFYYEK